MTRSTFDTGALLARTRARLDVLDEARGAAGVPSFCRQVRDVVVIASSSRGGSSVLSDVLRRTPQLLHFRGEVNPFFVLSGLSYPSSGTASDALGVEHLADAGTIARLEMELARDCGNFAPMPPDKEDLERFAGDLVRRLSMQWPHLELPLDALRNAVKLTLEDVGAAGVSNVPAFHARLLRHVHAIDANVNPYYYDLPAELVAEQLPELEVPEGPPGPLLIEEPPFVTIQPWSSATAKDLATKPLVMKTPSNVYRLAFLRSLFPEARFRVLHLLRNGASSINGLMDGWRHHGFFSNRVDQELDIAGYTEESRSFSRHWWKFDLPPGWEQLRKRPLVDVCAFQWLKAHQATLDYLNDPKNGSVDTLRIHFEDFIEEGPGRVAAIGALTKWLGIDIDEALGAVVQHGMPPVMATAPPRKRRWSDREPIIKPVLDREPIKKMMETLGYEDDPISWR